MKPIQREQWPSWANEIAAWSTPVDIGVGSTVHRLAATPGAIYERIRAAIKWPCGCAARRQEWDQKYPYRPVSQTFEE